MPFPQTWPQKENRKQSNWVSATAPNTCWRTSTSLRRKSSRKRRSILSRQNRNKKSRRNSPMINCGYKTRFSITRSISNRKSIRWRMGCSYRLISILPSWCSFWNFQSVLRCPASRRLKRRKLICHLLHNTKVISRYNE